MIRAVDFDPSITYSATTLGQSPDPQWKQSLHEIDGYGLAVFRTGLALKAIRQIEYLKGFEPMVTGLEALLSPIGRITQIANLSLSSEQYVLGEHSIQGGAEVAQKWVTFASWVATFERFAVSTHVITLLSSLGLSISFSISMMDLIASLTKAEADYGKIAKHSYKVGVSLLAVYLFMTSIALSASLTALIAGGNFAISYI